MIEAFAAVGVREGSYQFVRNWMIFFREKKPKFECALPTYCKYVTYLF